MDSPEILKTARAGKSQDVIVNFRTDGFDLRIAKRRGQLGIDRATDPFAYGQTNEERDDEELARDLILLHRLRRRLAGLKKATFSNGAAGDCRIVHDFSASASALVRVPDYPSLMALLSNPNVQEVYANGFVQVPETWRSESIVEPGAAPSAAVRSAASAPFDPHRQ